MTDQEFALDLQRLESMLRTKRIPVVDFLRPGLPTNEVESRLAGAGFQVTDDLVTWFSWHDGADLDGWRSVPLFYSFPFNSLDAAIAWARGEAADDLLLEELEGWAPFSYVPLFAEDKTKTLGLAFNVGDHHVVRLGWYDAPGFVAHGSLQHFVRRLTDAYMAGAHYYDPSSQLMESDPELLAQFFPEGFA